MDRRTVLRTSMLGVAGLSLPGCATTTSRSTVRSGCLPPVQVSADRVIRTLAGLRPYRASGFVVRRETFGDKALVHNYGHGSAGITLSWGSAKLATELGLAGHGGSVAVIGCGVMGLSTARLVQEAGFPVTIYAKALPPETTSNIAGGQWWPASVFSAKDATPQFMAQFEKAAKLSYLHFQQLSAPEYGVRWTRNYSLDEGDLGASPLFNRLAALAPERRTVPAGQHPFGAAVLQHWDSMMVEPPIYLQAMMEDVLAAGGRIVVRDFNSQGEVQALKEQVVFNCTGLGAGELFGDKEMIPARGQLVVLLPQPEVTYNLLSNWSYMFPRRDGIILGGTFERGNWSTDEDPATTAKILANHKAMFAKLKV